MISSQICTFLSPQYPIFAISQFCHLFSGTFIRILPRLWHRDPPWIRLWWFCALNTIYPLLSLQLLSIWTCDPLLILEFLSPICLVKFRIWYRLVIFSGSLLIVGLSRSLIKLWVYCFIRLKLIVIFSSPFI